MRLSAEMFALINLGMDALAALAASRLCGARASPLRILTSAILGTVYAFVQMIWPLRGVFAAGACAVVIYIMAAVAIPVRSIQARLRACAAMMACQFIAGGACTMFARVLDRHKFLCGICAMIACIWGMDRMRRHAAGAVSITCIYKGRRARLRALVDTGNRLCDPLTGLPVIAAPKDALGDLVPPDVDPLDPQTLPPGFRLLRAQTAAGPCLLMCFHPQELIIRCAGRSVHAHALIALAASSEGTLALVPSQMLDEASINVSL